MRACLIGQASVKFEVDKKVILFDPWFGTKGFLYKLFAKRIVPLAIKPQEIKRCDYIISTHNHIDHFDNFSIEIAKRLGSIVVGSKKVAVRAKKAGLKKVHRMSRGDSVKLNGITVNAIFAEHPLAKDAVSYVVKTLDDRHIYFSGDTRFKNGLVEDLKKYKIDIAMLQVSCADSFITGGEDGMNIKTAFELAKRIKPKKVIPIHYHLKGKLIDPDEKVIIKEDTDAIYRALEKFKNNLSKEKISTVILEPGVETEV